MKQSKFPDYDKLNHALQHVAEELHASEMHGLICGMLAGDPKSANAWKQNVLAGNDVPPEVDAVLQDLFDASSEQLKESLFELRLVLPDDEVDLGIRAEALTLWVQGFLTGLKMTNVPVEDREPSEVTEVIHDMVEIAKMNHEEVVATEEDEIAFAELVEYVRMGVIMIFEETEEKQASASNQHLH